MKIVKETVWHVVEQVSVRTLVERYKASNENIHCMHGLKYATDIDSELREFHNSWDWIAKQNSEKKLYVIDNVEQMTYLT